MTPEHPNSFSIMSIYIYICIIYIYIIIEHVRKKEGKKEGKKRRGKKREKNEGGNFFRESSKKMSKLVIQKYVTFE